MSTWSRVKLSGSTNGKAIKVTTTATPGDLIHTAVAGTSNWDHPYIWANNTDSVARVVTVQWGGVADPDDHITEIELPSQSGATRIVHGLMLQNGLVIRVFASAANVVIISGFVNRNTA